MNEATGTSAGTPAPSTTPAAAPATAATTPNAAATPSTAEQQTPPTSRKEARALILQSITATPPAAPAPTNTDAPGEGKPAATPADTTKPEATAETALEIHPETGPSPELGSLKLRFKGGDGQYTPIPEALAAQKFELEVGGKTIVKDLPGIARLAADGIANQRHASENHQLRTQVIPQYEQHVGSLQQQLQAQIALNREMLSDETRYAQYRQQFAELNSPEQRADRAERALEDRDRLESQRTQSQQSTAYYNANVLPAMTAVFDESPTVTNEEILGKIAFDTSDLLGSDGKVPPENYPMFVHYLKNTLAPWAKGLHTQRSQADTARRESEQREAREREEAARREAQLATRSVGAMVPASTNANTMSPASPAELPPPKSRAEARDRIRQAVRAGAAG